MNIIDYTLVDRLSGADWPAKPFFFHANLFDIPITIIKACQLLPDNCVGISILRQDKETNKLINNEVKQYIEFIGN